MTLHLSLLEPAADDESVQLLVPSDSVAGGKGGDPLTMQTFPIATGAQQQDVVIDVSHFLFGRSLGVTLIHGSVIVGIANTDPVRDTCTASAEPLATSGGLVAALLEIHLVFLRCSLLGHHSRVGLDALATARN